MAETVGEQVVQVGERRVFLRHAGRGPAVVLLHQSPQSSAAMLPLMARLAQRHAVFAPDTPGFGLSDPLPLAQPTIPDLARALGDLLQALGLQRVVLYGVHTGAVIAARLAHDRPGCVAGLLCDGLALFTADERQPLLDGYLPPFEPSWDGTHLLWLWARIREQYRYFPWHVHSAATRLRYPPMPVEKLHADVMDVLAAGDGFRAGYRAPLLYADGAAVAAALAVPAWLLYRDTDVLRPHLARLSGLPTQVRAASVADDAALAQSLCDFAASHAQAAVDVDAERQVAQAAACSRFVSSTAQGRLGWHMRIGNGTADATLVLSIGDIGTPAQWAMDAPAAATAVAVDLPGHGASSAWCAQGLTVAAIAVAIQGTLNQHPDLAGRAVELRACGGSAALAVALAARLGARCRSLRLHDPLPLDAEETARFLATLPTLQVQAGGEHLLAAWNWARERRLYWLWRPADAGCAVPAAAPPPLQVHTEVQQMLRAGPLWSALWRLCLHDGWQLALRSLDCPITLSSSPHDEPMRLCAKLTQEMVAGGGRAEPVTRNIDRGTLIHFSTRT